ncbi:MAG: AAA family ATPase [Alphaproteobacteria bacterium]|nr:AAA family ATPase [Alphaproteobacteria bacterium]
MIVLISGASHTGKTLLAQKLMEKYHFPYLSIDLLKMGMIRSKKTNLTPYDDKKITEYIWPIIKEIIKTAIENNQNLIIEGCYIPYDWKKDFDEKYLSKIKYICLIMSEKYILNHFKMIKNYANIIENRLFDDCNAENLIDDNKKNLENCKNNNLDYIFIDDGYAVDFIL